MSLLVNINVLLLISPFTEHLHPSLGRDGSSVHPRNTVSEVGIQHARDSSPSQDTMHTLADSSHRLGDGRKPENPEQTHTVSSEQ